MGLFDSLYCHKKCQANRRIEAINAELASINKQYPCSDNSDGPTNNCLPDSMIQHTKDLEYERSQLYGVPDDSIAPITLDVTKTSNTAPAVTQPKTFDQSFVGGFIKSGGVRDIESLFNQLKVPIPNLLSGGHSGTTNTGSGDNNPPLPKPPMTTKTKLIIAGSVVLVIGGIITVVLLNTNKK